MRRLIAQTRARLQSDARGAVSVIVALSLVAMFGFAALAIDTGMLYAERAELQSGADAAALAIAQDCSQGINCNPTDAALVAQDMAEQNAGDGAAESSVPVFNDNTVRVTVTTRDKSGAGSLALNFAPVLGIDDRATVSATASAAWGAPLSGTAVWPVAFAQCEFDLSGQPQAITFGEKGGTLCPDYALDGSVNPPGGFAWIGEDSKDTCAQPVSVGTNVQSTGISLPAGCDDTEAVKLQNRTILIPVYDEKGGNGSKGWYGISGWAAFHVEGYAFTGSTSWNGAKVMQNCGGNCNGFYGRFVRFTTFDEGFTMGPPSSFGVSVVDLRE